MDKTQVQLQFDRIDEAIIQILHLLLNISHEYEDITGCIYGAH